MEVKIEIPDEVIHKIINEKIEKMGFNSKKEGKVEVIDSEKQGSFLKTVLAVSKNLPKDETYRTGIRFKFNGETVETSINTSTKAEANKILRQYGLSISKFCHAALQVIISEHNAIEERLKKS